MNFLFGPPQPLVSDLASIPETDSYYIDDRGRPISTLEGLIGEDSFRDFASLEDGADDADRVEEETGEESAHSAPEKEDLSDNYSDLSGDEGWIIIPNKQLPDNWFVALSMEELQAMDRSFLLPGEQVNVLACVSAKMLYSQTIIPSKDIATNAKNGNPTQNGSLQTESFPMKSGPSSEIGGASHGEHNSHDSEYRTLNSSTALDPECHVPETQSFLQMEDHLHMESILEKFRSSNFFVRISELDEPLWPRKKKEQSPLHINILAGKSTLRRRGYGTGSGKYNTMTEKGFFNVKTSGGLVRDEVRCYTLSNGDILVLLRVNVGVTAMNNPVLEVLQFQKSISDCSISDGSSVIDQEDPCRELLSWLFPLERALPPRLLAPQLASTVSHKSTYSSSGSQIFSFNHFRSYSMPSLPHIVLPVQSSNTPILESEEFSIFESEKMANHTSTGQCGQLSFRGVPLEPERYSVHCGLEGMYLSGCRWRRKIHIIQPIEVSSFSAKCTTDNLLCVQIKNVAPTTVPGLVIFVDAVTIILEEDSKSGGAMTLPTASIETGTGSSLPNLALRQGEEQSLILKPSIIVWGQKKLSEPNHKALLNKLPTTRVRDIRVAPSPEDQYSVLVSYRCNYTESKLFYKQMTSWRPSMSGDIMISVSSEPYKQFTAPSERVPQLPVQVLTLEATNLTSEDLTLTVLAPEPSISAFSLLSLNSAMASPMSSREGLREIKSRTGGSKYTAGFQPIRSMIPGSPVGNNDGDDRPISALSCTHLWLQSTVPLGCVPAHSSASVKLELLPLVEGIITLDTLQIDIKERGLICIPEHSLEIHATSSIFKGVL